MKKTDRSIMGLVCGLLTLFVSVAASAQSRPDRVILFTIDGLAVGAPERFAMPTLRRLAAEGCRYEAMHLPLPGHPKNDPRYPWSCSMPNPMLMAGTPFIGVEGIRDAMIQHQFKSNETAFVVNAYSYQDVSGGFGTYVAQPHAPDALVIAKAQETLLGQNPKFMRVHLQRSGIEGEKVSKDRYADRPWYRNIWHPESPYREACERADGLLGDFVDWLTEQNLWQGTVLVVCGDHGQADEGWHEPYSPPSGTTPLVLIGAGIPAGRTFPYCEIFDIAPTLAALAGREAPPQAIGRVLEEALDAGRAFPDTSSRVELLNRVLRAANELEDGKRATLVQAGFLTTDEVGRWHSTEAGSDFNAFVSRQEEMLPR